MSPSEYGVRSTYAESRIHLLLSHLKRQECEGAVHRHLRKEARRGCPCRRAEATSIRPTTCDVLIKKLEVQI